uniref:Uncharacterized protein n=1 Tax=Clandestinovirus TaxID=2831644 RepID=A0A8F8PK46_9VIRU|nr:hypothetical protein KOM_12_370 [Clandestinovirus]
MSALIPNDIIQVIQNKKQSIKQEKTMEIFVEFIIPWMYRFRLNSNNDGDPPVFQLGNMSIALDSLLNATSPNYGHYESSFTITAMKRVSTRLRNEILAGEGTISCIYNGHAYFRSNPDKLKRFE